jgi:hypothetical protein
MDLSADAIGSFLRISDGLPRVLLCQTNPAAQTSKIARCVAAKRLGAVHGYHPTQVGFFLQFPARENKGAEDDYTAKPLDFRIPPGVAAAHTSRAFFRL